MKSKPIISLFVVFAVVVAFTNPTTNSLRAADQKAEPQLQVAISPDIPPYVTQKATGGLEVELVRRALQGYSLRFVQMPYKNLQTAIPQKRAVVSVGVQTADDGVFYSGNYLTFVNVAVTKKPAGIKLESIADLKDHRVLAWQNADLELGDAFKQLFASKSPQRKNYVEVADQQQQVQMFWAAKDDVIVIDRNIFSHFSKSAGHALGEVTLHFLFPPTTEFKVGFQDAALRDEFDRNMAELCSSGEYATLLRKYEVELPKSDCERIALEQAVMQFYAALNALFTGDLEPMQSVWSHADDVTYLGPDGKYQVGWEQVLADWQSQAELKLGGKVEPQKIHITYGPELAVVNALEVGENTNANGQPAKISLRATNVFRKEQGKWKMIGHHTDLLPFLAE